ncbi:MAG: HTTM domain-containing protein [Bacteroidia bacterium]|nr:HTTM domain-containing protein [Bacteroidia bacterium]NND25402.1 HTTM domain-containing protein [Flavobacteriaceae bacterium]MBT8279363.1 HTTM domain-containing protein [Bacteroidia bacterium]NNK60261.1 HTTM domain-containing protein [Flavobacteriaceae bacterium]NNL34069.1 HTTM domain-containing protein [Flavobacteriaceae bacterium]
MIKSFLFKHIDNSALIVFRIFFGLLIALEAFGAVVTGWVNDTLIDPEFTFAFIGFEWLQPLPGSWMYIYYAIMGIFGVMVMLGYRYRLSILAYTIMWTATYFMQKASYNNHYYLLILLCLIMAILPANRYLSLDVKRDPNLKSISMPRWCSWILIIQMWIVYTYASIAKMYGDWLDTSVAEILMKSKQHYYVVGEFFQNKGFHYFLAYSGIIFDLLVIPLLLWKPTRKWAFFASIFFHLFNSIVFQVGIFPYMSLALCLFFFEPQTIRNIFLKKKTLYEGQFIEKPKHQNVFLSILSVYFIIQLVLPIRHHFIQDNVLWTEEGHRLSWRMMLRSRVGLTTYTVVNKDTNKAVKINLDDHLSKKQKQIASTRPDVIWQFSQYLKQLYAKDGQDIAVYVNSQVKVNGRRFQKLIDPEIDMASVKWNAFKHSPWILPSQLDKSKASNP